MKKLGYIYRFYMPFNNTGHTEPSCQWRKMSERKIWETLKTFMNFKETNSNQNTETEDTLSTWSRTSACIRFFPQLKITCTVFNLHVLTAPGCSYFQKCDLHTITSIFMHFWSFLTYYQSIFRHFWPEIQQGALIRSWAVNRSITVYMCTTNLMNYTH